MTDLSEFCKRQDISFLNRWILSRYNSILKEIIKALDVFRLNEAANILYGFFWHEFCDWYLEMIKPEIKNFQNQIVMYSILEKSLRTLHPFMPFITEEIWQRIQVTRSPGRCAAKRSRPEGDQVTSIMVQVWPQIQEQMIDKRIEKHMQSLFEVIKGIRNLRSSIEIKPEQKVSVSIFAQTKIKRNLIQDNRDLITNLARLETLHILDSTNRPHDTISDLIKGIDIYLHFQGLIEISKERDKIRNKINSLREIIKARKTRIKNTEFLKKAPTEIVKKEKESIQESLDTLERLVRMSHELH
jgi:valyl-tRNA synthetase